MAINEYFQSESDEKAIIVSVSLSGDDDDAKMRFSEMTELVDTAGASVILEVHQNKHAPDKSTYIGTGKAAEIAEQVTILKPDFVVFDDELSPTQQRNLIGLLKVPVFDRTQLILDIFAQRARTREGSLQVELAQLSYLLPRLSAQYTKFERQQGGIGGRGPGETKLEHDRRKVRDRIGLLSREIDDVREQRNQQRQIRKKLPFPVCAIVGYTSAGKSTLLNTLSGSDVYADARLFATLDPTTRKVDFPDGGSLLMTDTVGFIRHLPHDLVAAFRATLEEVAEADFLLHVVDTSHPERDRQMQAVLETLEELKVGEKPIITVYNKSDLITDSAILHQLIASTPLSCYISATKQEGISHLLDCISIVMKNMLVSLEAAIPYNRSELVPQCYENGKVRSLSYEPEYILVNAEVSRDLAGKLEPFVKNKNSQFYRELYGK
jgi:GTP-binding protein HflX